MDTFPVGKILNPITAAVPNSAPIFRNIQLKYPARLNAMALDPSKINVNANGIYTPGEVIFSIGLYKVVSLKLRADNNINITEMSPRPQLIRHAALIMRSALGTPCGFDIDVQTDDLKHCGLGSSSGLIAAVATTINELFGNPIERNVLITYLAQNHGEEIDGDDFNLQHVQCIGGAAAAGL